ncbi:MAG: recombinase family protein, partial [Phycisphaerae bacterium]|nr:recombinase family protein [Phycisphaerae bacterium]
NEFGSDAAGVLSFNMMAAVSQYYSDNLRQEVRKGQDEKIRQGWLPCGVPYGYVNSKDREEPIRLHPERAKLVIRVFELYSHGGMTFDMIADQIRNEGFIYRPTQPRLTIGYISYMLANRFYVGDIVWRGQVYSGKHKPLVDRETFNLCRKLLKGKNRRTRRVTHPLANGLLLCKYCGSMITGEVINRKLKGGGVRTHRYYRCANNKPGPDHPRVRWREEDLEDAIVAELDTLKMPTPELTAWFRETMIAAFDNKESCDRQQRLTLGRQRAEFQQQDTRLLDAYLAGHIDKTTFQDRTTEIKGRLRELDVAFDGVNGDANSASEDYGAEKSAMQGLCGDIMQGHLEGVRGHNQDPPTGDIRCRDIDPACRDMAVGVFDFAQRAGEIWRGSKIGRKQRILRSASLNRVLGDVSVEITKRKPLDLLPNPMAVSSSRGDPASPMLRRADWIAAARLR